MGKKIRRVISSFLVFLILLTNLQLPVFGEAAASVASMDLSVAPLTSSTSRIDSGWGFTLALLNDGRVAAWGDNEYGQCDVPPTLDNVIAIAAGSYHALALKADGTVTAWGFSGYGQCDVPAGLNNVVAIAAGRTHSLALTSAGTVVAWGLNDDGQCDIPAELQQPGVVRAIAAGYDHSLALKQDGTVVAWGYTQSEWGELNPAELTNPDTARFVAIAAPWGHDLAVRDDGTVFAWGNNNLGQATVPADLTDVVAVAGSYANSLALLGNGSVVAWGGGGEYSASYFVPPADLSDVIAISSQAKGCVALRSDYSLVAWGITGVPEGASLIPKPEIMYAEISSDNTYVDVYFNMGVYAAGMEPLTLSSFRSTFESNGGGAFAVTLTSLTRIDGSAVVGGETALRFHLDINGEPTSHEIMEIRPYGTQSVFSIDDEAMAVTETSGPIRLNAILQSFVGIDVASDNTYADVTLNIGAYGDSNQSTPVTKDDLVLAFVQNGGNATRAQLLDITKLDGTPLEGGETELRCQLDISGKPSGDETIALWPQPESVYSPAGVAMLSHRSSRPVNLNPPSPEIIATELAPDNSYLDVTFNTGVYGGIDWQGDEPCGAGPVMAQNLRLFFNSWGGGAEMVSIRSVKMADFALEAGAAELRGGEKTLRLFLDLEGTPTGVETLELRIEAVFSSAGEVYSIEDDGIIIPMQSSILAFALSPLALNNRYVDLNFTSGVYGDAAAESPIAVDDLLLLYSKNDGLTENVTLAALTKPDSTHIAEASPLSGGERVVRAWLNLSNPAQGHLETIEIKPAAGNSLFNGAGVPMAADRTTKRIPLFPSRPDVLSATLAPDNSYIDMHFNFGIYGDAEQLTAVTVEQFGLSFYRNGGTATDVSILAVRQADSIQVNEASSLVGGETTLRFFLQITGAPSGLETVQVRTSGKSVYNQIGNAMQVFDDSQSSGELRLNAILKIVSAALAEDMSYLDVLFNTGVHGDMSQASVPTLANFALSFAQNGGTASGVALRSVKRNNASVEAEALPLQGGETTLRFFLDVHGSPSGQESIALRPNYENPPFSDSGNPILPGQSTRPVLLTAPAPEIVSTRLAPDNSYLDITFNVGVYGWSGSGGVTWQHFQVLTTQNWGDTQAVYIDDVRQPDGDDHATASALQGGEKTIRVFLQPDPLPSGGEYIELLPASGYRLYSYSGQPMDEAATTGLIHLIPFPKITRQEVAADNSYVDVSFNVGVYGDPLHNTPITPDSLKLTFERGALGSMLRVEIKSVKQADSPLEAKASQLRGGEQTVRVFLSTIGMANGHETITIDKKDENAIFDRNGLALPADKFVQPVRLKNVPLQIIGADLASDNSYLDVRFNAGVYGAPDGATPVGMGHFQLTQGPDGLRIAAVKQADSEDKITASALVGGETTLRCFLDRAGVVFDDQVTLTLGLQAANGGPAVYSIAGVAMGATQNTGPVKANDLRIKVVATEVAWDNSYLDVTFNKGIYGDTAQQQGVSSNSFTLLCQSANATVRLQSVTQTDHAEQGSASYPVGGETVLRFFLGVEGQLQAGDTITILPSALGIYDAQGHPGFRNPDPIFLSYPAPAIVAAQLAKDNSYLDLSFNLGVYGDADHTMPVGHADFRLLLEQNGGTTTAVTISDATRPDGETAAVASPLTGGEKEIRLFLAWDSMPTGSETVEILPADGQSIFSSSRAAASTAETTGKILLHSYYPQMVMRRLDENWQYIDLTFNMGVYGADQGPALPESFTLALEEDQALPEEQRFRLLSWRLSQSPIDSPLTGGESTVRFWLETSGEPSGREIFQLSVKTDPSLYSIYGTSAAAKTTSIPVILPLPQIVSVSAAQSRGNLPGRYFQQVEVGFNTGVYGNAANNAPVTANDFQLIFHNNGSPIIAAPLQLNWVGEVPKSGGQTTLRFWIETDGPVTGKETIEILAVAGQIQNSQGESNGQTLTTGIVRLTNVFAEVESVAVGERNRYIDVGYNRPINGVTPGGGQRPARLEDFVVIFKKNGGTAHAARLTSVRQPNSAIESNAAELQGSDLVFRFFLQLTGLPNGQETIEILPRAASLVSELDLPVESGTGPIRLAVSAGDAWIQPEGVVTEPLGWMSDRYLSNSDSEALVLRNDGTVVAPIHTVLPPSDSDVTAVAAGSGFGLALKRNGTVVGWGKITVPDGITGVRAIAAAGSMAYVLVGDFTVGRWSLTEAYQEYQTSEPIAAIAVGSDDHWLTLHQNGTVFGYGNNDRGQRFPPSGLMQVKSIAAANGYSLALKTDGTVVGWGAVDLPAGLSGVAAISAGDSGYLVLKEDGIAALYDLQGQALAVPAGVELTDVIALAAGKDSYSLLRANGEAQVWTPAAAKEPINVYVNALLGTLSSTDLYVDIELYDTKTGQARGFFGINGVIRAEELRVDYINRSPFVSDISITGVGKPTHTNRYQALKLEEGDEVVRVFLQLKGIPDGTETFVIRPQATYWVFTEAGDPLLGSQGTNLLQLQELPELRSLGLGNRIAAGWQHGLAIREDGTVLAWGGNEFGQIDVPMDLGPVKQVAAGYHHSVALASDGTLRVWGDNYYGQCNIPYGLKDIKQVAAGGYHTLAVDYSGKVYAWGDNFYGQCDVPAGLENVLWVEAGGHHSIALKTDGTLVIWGDDSFGQANWGFPIHLSSIRDGVNIWGDGANFARPLHLVYGVPIAAGEDFSVVLQDYPGGAVAAGDNSAGQRQTPSGVWDLITVAAGYHHGLALKEDGKVVAWGDNSQGQCDVPAELAGVKAIAAGALFSLAIKDNGSIIAWGDNSAGQCDVHADISAPRFVSSQLAVDNRYLDIVFSEGVYGNPGGSLPLNTASFSFAFDRGDSPDSTAEVTVKAVKRNDSTEVDAASPLVGGESVVRVFLDSKGYVAGTETLEFTASSSAAIFDSHGEPLTSGRSAGILTLNQLTQLPERWLDGVASTGDDQSRYGAKSIAWYQPSTLAVGADRILVVGLKCEEQGTAANIRSVTVNGTPMTPIVDNRLWDMQLALFYMLDADLPAAAGDYYIEASYTNTGAGLDGLSLLLTGMAQMGPESIALSGAVEHSFSEWTQATLLTTRTDGATVIELLSRQQELTKEYMDATILTASGSTLAVHRAGAAGEVTTCFAASGDPKTWLSVAVAFRSATFPAEPTAEARPPLPLSLPLSDYPAGESIAFSERTLYISDYSHWENSPHYHRYMTQSLLEHGDQLIAYTTLDWDFFYWDAYVVRSSSDGESWSAPHTVWPESTLFSAGGRLYAWVSGWKMVSYPVAGVSSSVDGVHWSRASDLPHDAITGMAANSDDPSQENHTVIAVGYDDYFVRWENPGQWNRKQVWACDSYVYYSYDDGTTWGKTVFPDTRLLGTLCLNGRFIAYDADRIWHSGNGKDWTLAKSFDGGHFTDLFERNGVLMLTGRGIDNENVNLFTSTDGVFWTRAKLIHQDPRITDFNGFSSIAYAQNTYAAVGGSYIAVAQAPEPDQISEPWEFSLYALDMEGVNYLASVNNRFYIRYGGALLGSDDLRTWYFESPNSGNGPIINFRDKAITTSGHRLLTGYRPLPVGSVTPYMGETGVPVDEPIVIGFGEGIKLVDDVQLINQENGTAHAIAVTVKDGQLILTPASPLAYNSRYTVVLNEGNVRNTVDTKANMTFTYSFFTTKRMGKPEIASTSLGDGTDVSAEEAIVIQFDRGIEAGPNFQDITIAPEDQPHSPVALSLAIVRSSVVVTPVQALEHNRTYVITLPEACVADNYGYFFAAWNQIFTVTADVTPPLVVKTLPPNYGERVPQAPTIEVKFNENMQAGAYFDQITLQNIRSNEATPIIASIPQGLGLDGKPLHDTLLIELSEQQTLELHHTYRVTVPAGAVTDMAGNPLQQAFSFVFMEEIGPSSPVLLESSPQDNSKEVDIHSIFTLLFDRPLGAGPNFGGSFTLNCPGYPDIYLTPEITRNKLTLRPEQPMAYGVTYRLRIPAYAIGNKNGDNAIATDIYLYFTAERQRVTATLPLAGGSGALINSVPQVSFDAAPQAGYRFGEMKLIRRSGDGDEAISVRPSLAGNSLFLTPEMELVPDSLYTVSLPRGAVRFADGSVNNQYTFDFVTGSERAELSEFTLVGSIELMDALVEGDLGTFNAGAGLPSTATYIWDFGDGTSTVSGRQVTHAFTYRGTYNVVLSASTDSGRYFVSQSLQVVRRPGRDNILIETNQRAPALLNPGDSFDYVLRLSTSGVPMLNRTVQVTRSYPASQQKEPELLATLTTDKNGMAAYRATLPDGCREYYVNFTYGDIAVRRILQNASEQCDLSGYVLNDKGEVLKSALVSIGNRATVTDASGFYQIGELEPGNYNLVVSTEFHYDYISNMSLYQKGSVQNIMLTKIVPTAEPLIRQVSVNGTAAKELHFLKGIDAEISIQPFVDWRGHQPDCLQLLLGDELLAQVGHLDNLTVNALDFKQGDKLKVVALSKDGISSQVVDVQVHIIDALPGDFPFDLQPIYIDGKYITERYIHLLPIRTPSISDIPILKGGPFAFLSDPVYAYGEMGVDGSFFVITSKDGTSSSGFGYYAENNIVQKYLAKRQATTAAEKKQIAAKQSKSYMGGVELDSRIGASFRWDFDTTKGAWVFDTGTLHLGISVNAWASASYGIPGVPLSVYINGDFEVIMDTYLHAINDNGSMSYGSGTLDLSHIFIEISGGISAVVAKAGVYFNGTGAVKVDFPSGDTKYYIEVTGGVRASALLWSVEYEFLKYSWGDRSPWLAQSGAQTLVFDAQGRQLSLNSLQGKDGLGSGLLPTSSAELKPMGRDYLQEQSGWNTGVNKQGGMMAMATTQDLARTTTLRRSTFPHTEHVVTPYGTGAFMVLLEDEASRPTLNQTRVKYSVYDGASWSQPLPIGADDGTADFNPVVAATTTGAIAAWANLNGMLAPDSQLGDALARQEIAVATYDAATKSWSSFSNLTSDSYHDHAPRLAATDAAALLVWVKSRSHNYDDALSGDYIAEHDVMFSQWDGGSFAAPEVIATFDRPLVNASLAFNDDQGIYVFALDEDGNLNTVTDQETYCLTFDYGTASWSSPHRLTDNIVRDSNPQACFINGKAFVLWEQDGDIVYLEDVEAAHGEVKVAVRDTILQNTFTLAADGNSLLALVGPGLSSNNGADMYGIIYDGVHRLWSKELRLTEDYSTNRSPSAAFTGDELVTIYNRDIIVDKVNPADGLTYPTISNKADLRMIAQQLIHDLAIVDDSIALSEANPFPGGLVDISAEIENRGSYSEAATEVAFYAGDPLAGGQRIGKTQTIAEALAPGASTEVTVQWEIPAVMPTDGIYVVVDPAQRIADAERSNNTANLRLLRPDLELVNLECLATEAGSYIVTVKVSNVSAVDVPHAVVSLHYGDSAGGLEFIAGLDAGAMKAGEVVEMTYLWTPTASMFQQGKTDLFAIVEVADVAVQGMSHFSTIVLEEESILDNNIRMLTVASSTAPSLSYTVTFKDWNGSVLKVQTVPDGGTATAPANPTRSGYTFTGWDKGFDNVTGDLTVTAQYSRNPRPVDPDSGDGGGPVDPGPAPLEPALVYRRVETEGQVTLEARLTAGLSPEIIALKAQGKTTITINIDEAVLTEAHVNVLTIQIPRSIVRSLNGLEVIVNSPYGSFALPPELVATLAASGEAIAFSLQSGDHEVIQTEISSEEGLLGEPVEITTSLTGNVRVTLPCNLPLPQDAEARATFLASLYVLAIHDVDDVERILALALDTDEETSTLLSVTFQVDRFSTFALVAAGQQPIEKPECRLSTTIGGTTYTVNDSVRNFANLTAYRANDSTTVMAVRLLQELGAKIAYRRVNNRGIVTVTYGEITATLRETSNIMTVVDTTGERQVTLRTVFTNLAGRTYLPTRDVAESLGFSVYWAAADDSLVIE